MSIATHIESLRKSIFDVSWSLHFAGYAMQILRCDFQEGLDLAQKAKESSPHWRAAHPKEVAKFQIEKDGLTVYRKEEIDNDQNCKKR